MISVEQARRKFVASVQCRQDTEVVPLAEALLRVAAADVFSGIVVPPDDNSAMDGFAVNSADLSAGELELEISQRVPAGSVPLSLTPGTAARIFTGGVLPNGADAVVIQENCEFSELSSKVKILKSVRQGQNVRPAGQDIALGAKIVSAGQRLSAIMLGLLASAGVAQVSVFKRLNVAVFSTGNELIEPGQPLQNGQIYNSNRTMLLAACVQLGYAVIDCGIVEDTLSATRTALSAAAEKADIILTSGGVSVGDEDHIRPAIESLGELNHWKVQMKPGKPVVLGRIRQTAVLGLPGNPVSSFVVFQLLGVPLLGALQGLSATAPPAYPVKSGFAKAKVSREEYIRVRYCISADGQHTVENFSNQSSGVLSSLSWADGLVRQHIGQNIRVGDVVDFLPLREGML